MNEAETELSSSAVVVVFKLHYKGERRDHFYR